jgi:tRNA(fMet)-specific endonuclease VapC
MLDADSFALWEKGEFDLPRWLEARGDEPVAISAVVWEQLWFAAEKWQPERSAKRRAKLQAIYPAVRIIPFDVAQAREAARLDARLKTAGQPIGWPDTLIAAAALVCQAELLTFNRAEFDQAGVPLARI